MKVGKARALIAIGADSKQLDRDLAEARKKLKGFKDTTKKLGGKLLGGAKGIAGSVLGGAGMAGAFGLADVVGDIRDFETSLTRFQIAAGKSNEDMAKMRKSILDVSRATGVGTADVLAGAQTYVDLTGDVEGATKAMSSFARIAQASGASVSDVAQATAAMQMSGKLAAEDIEAVWSGLITQGKAGAVSVKDMAGELATLMPMMAKFAGGTGPDGIRDMGAAFQVVRRGAGSAAEASTKLQSLVGTIVKSSPKLRKHGINVFAKNAKTGKRELIGFRDIIGQISKKGFDAEKLGKILGTDKESLQALDMLTKELALYDQLKQAGQDRTAVDKDFATFQESTAGKLERAFAAAKASIAEAFTPERIAKFVDALAKALEFVADIVHGIEKIAGFMSVDVDKDTKEWGEKKAKELIKGSEKLTPEQKRAKAAQLLKEARQIAKSGDTNPMAVSERESKFAASDALNRQVDAWHGGSGSSISPIALSRTAVDMAKALASQPTIVKVGAEPVVKAHGNAMAHRTRPGGH